MDKEFVIIDGSKGEGGGQVLRSSLCLSMITGRPFRIDHIRHNRPRSGLMRQHLTAVRAAKELCHAQVVGDEMKSTSLEFIPGELCAGSYEWDIGSAGSTGLVLQTLFYPLALAEGTSQITIKGGTHNPSSPSADFLQRTWLPTMRSLGFKGELDRKGYGFYPAGGGEIQVQIEGVHRSSLKSFEAHSHFDKKLVQAEVLGIHLPEGVVEREKAKLMDLLDLSEEQIHIPRIYSPGPGNVVQIEIQTNHGVELISSFGSVGVSAEEVVSSLAKSTRQFLQSEACVGIHLADQVLLPMALGAGGVFRTHRITNHLRTHAEVIQAFLGVKIEFEELGERLFEVRVRV